MVESTRKSNGGQPSDGERASSREDTAAGSREDTAPDEDFEEAGADADLTEDEDEAPTAEYDTEEEVPAEEVEDLDVATKEVSRRERQRLKDQDRIRREQLDALREKANTDAAAGEALRGKRRLDFLLRQAEVFQHFAPAAAAGAEAKKKRRGRHGAAITEEQEDEELLKDEDGSALAPTRITQQPKCITHGKLREYQLQGLNWLVHLYDNGINGILADEMGLGKTLQTISLLAYLRESRGITGPHMVIVPKSTLHNWLNEFRRWCPSIRAVKFHGNAEQRAEQKAGPCAPGAFDVVVTSYEMVIKEKNHWRRFHFRYVIIDEAHRIKNENSILSRVVRTFRTNYRMLITGTPLQNNLHELWALLNFLLPEVFSSAERFDEWFGLGAGGAGGGAGGGDGGGDGKEAEAEVVQQLHKVLRPFLLRRLKSDVEKTLPPKKETILKIGMSDMQRRYYAALLQKDMDAVTGGADRSRLLNVVMQLRKCCNHPYLFQGAEPGPPYVTGDHLVENSGKLVLLDKLLPKLQARGSRVLVFSQMTRMLDVLEDYLLYRGYKYCRIDGNTSGEDREQQIDEYNAPNSEKFVFLLSTRAGGLGINLYTADIVVLYDSDWNPQMDLQAMDRAHRIGQKKEVQVFRLCTEHTIEEKVIEKAYKKLRLDALVIQQGRLVEQTKGVNKDDLLSMVRYGAEMVFSSSEASTITDEDIDAIIQRGVDSTKELNDKLQTFTDDAMRFTMDGGLSAYDFEEKPDTTAETAGAEQLESLKALMGANWVDPPERKRKRVASYAENEFFRQAAGRGGGGGGGGGGGRGSGPRLAKMPQLQDFQFYDVPRLAELYDKEHAHDLAQHALQQRAAQARAQGASEETIAKEVQPGPDDPPELTEEEKAERERLLAQGFGSWSRRDFNAFVRACERHGRDALDDVAAELEGKTPEEVRAYAAVFWKRVHELQDADRILKNVERGEQRIQRGKDIMAALRAKLSKYRNPWLELRVSYGPAKGKAYSEEEDRFLVCKIAQLGYGAWDELKAAVRADWRFKFDWFIKSRSPQELARRCDTLIRLIEKEQEDEEQTGGTGGGRRPASAGGRSRRGAATPSADGDAPTPAPGGRKRRASAGEGGRGKAARAASLDA